MSRVADRSGLPAAPFSAPSAAAPSEIRTVRERVPALDGIRGTAALLVMVYHFGRPAVHGVGTNAIGFVAHFGWVGVDLFFVLSGFLIGGILLDTKGQPGFLRTFYKRRTLRIFPLYFAFVAAFAFVLLPLLPGPRPHFAARLKWLWVYLENFDIAKHGWYAGEGSHANALWSLAIEEQFYLITPFVVLAVSRGSVARLAIGTALVSIAARFALDLAGFPSVAGYVLTFARLDSLSTGVLLAVLAREGNTIERLTGAAAAGLAACVALSVAFAARMGGFFNEEWRTLKFALPVVTLGCGTLLVLVLSPSGPRFIRGTFELKLLRALGTYSYGLYIWHLTVGRFVDLAGFSQRQVARMVGSSGAGVLLTMVVKMAASLVVAFISYRMIERPFLKLKDRTPRIEKRPTNGSFPASTP